MEIDDGNNGSARAFFETTADLVTVKGIVLLLFLTGITAASIATGEAVEGVIPGAVLTALLVIAVVYEDVQNDVLDTVGVVAVVLGVAYTGLEYVEVAQGVWFPLVAAFLLLVTAGVGAWKKTEGTDDPAVFVENIDIVGLHGSILFILYAILSLGAPSEFLFSPVLPAALLFFALSLLGTTVAYAVRSFPAEAESNELHQKLVSVVRGLDEIETSEDRESLGSHVRSVAQALSGVRVPSRVEVSEGRVPVVLPDSGAEIYEARDVDDMVREIRERDLTGYAVSDDGNVLISKNGETVVYYIAPKDEFGTNPDVLPYGYFGESELYASTYGFVDAVESVLPNGRAHGETSGTKEETVETEPKTADETQGDRQTAENEGKKDVQDEKTETPFEDDVDIGGKLSDADDVFD